MARWSTLKHKLLENPEVMKEYKKLPSVDIAAQIINARARKGITQIELAKLAGTSQSAIARLERGNYTGYTIKTLIKIVDALDFNLDIKLYSKS
ncbi:MAG: helix-turn-helix transcriptional regulator [Candidatus Eremiobacterota bacterium]